MVIMAKRIRFCSISYGRFANRARIVEASWLLLSRLTWKSFFLRFTTYIANLAWILRAKKIDAFLKWIEDDSTLPRAQDACWSLLSRFLSRLNAAYNRSLRILAWQDANAVIGAEIENAGFFHFCMALCKSMFIILRIHVITFLAELRFSPSQCSSPRLNEIQYLNILILKNFIKSTPPLWTRLSNRLPYFKTDFSLSSPVVRISRRGYKGPFYTMGCRFSSISPTR